MTRTEGKIRRIANGAILYDPDLLPDAADTDFDAAHWRHASTVRGGLRSSGRTATTMLRDDRGAFVLRHFVRGGLISRLVSDRYLWLGEEATRAFREWRLLARMRAMELCVPRPAAARYLRRNFHYRADLLTVLIPDVTSLCDRIAARSCDERFWQRLGAAIATFHKAGVCHADLNAYNVQVDSNDKVWLIDFDRGRLTEPGPWQRRNLARLRRSLQKIGSQDPARQFSETDWDALQEGYYNS